MMQKALSLFQQKAVRLFIWLLFTISFVKLKAQVFDHPLHYTCQWAKAPLQIDGKATEAAWLEAAWTASFVDIEGHKKPQPYLDTRVKMLWDTDYFYFYAEMEEPHIWAKLKQRDTVIFYDNDFEIFIDPDGDTHNYYEFEVNAFNTVWDLLLTRPYRDGGHAIDHWDIHGLKSAVHLNGTINDPTDKDKGWSIEVAIPWDALSEATRMKTPPREGDMWRVNFSRVQWETEAIDGRYLKKKNPETGKNLPENNWVWSPMGAIAMHEPEYWGIVQFSERPVDHALTEEKGFELIAKAMLYEIHRAQKQRKRDKNSYADNLKDLNLIPLRFKDRVLNTRIFVHISGYLVQIGHTDMDHEWMLDQTGRSWKVKN